MSGCQRVTKMAEYIDKEKFMQSMYHEAFEKDSDLQRWDGGCWIRYKMLENVMAATPAADVRPVVICRDCKYSHMTHDGMCKYCDQWIENGVDEALYVPGDFFCAFGERRTEDG